MAHENATTHDGARPPRRLGVGDRLGYAVFFLAIGVAAVSTGW